MKVKYLIIGSSAASIGAINGIRQADKSGSIAVIGEEEGKAYGRPLISYYLQGRTTKEKMSYMDEGFYLRNAVELYSGVRAKKIDVAKKAVKTDKAGSIGYEKLLVATGSVPFVPPMEGLDGQENAHTFMRFSDASAIEKELDENSRVVIVGGGLIGLKAAEGIYEHTKNITVVELAPRVLSTVLDEEGSEIVRERLEKAGVRFELGKTVKSVVGKKKITSVVLTDGLELPLDALVLAIGVRPNTALAKDAGIIVDRGIKVDDFMRTSEKDVFAAGDAAQGYDDSSEQSRILALWVNAARQGFTAGITMAGAQIEKQVFLPLNAIGLFGLSVATAGVNAGEKEGFTVRTERNGEEYRRIVEKDGRLRGYVLMGREVRGAGILTEIIYQKYTNAELSGDTVHSELNMRLMPLSYQRAALELMQD
ncbi:MAG: FAD-dependent oxidoreductase [Eubacteriales bacterium]|nr:FAD-dependent oxidoreductase [Eubacteriales bacterium]MDD3881978.1 FAD-dependent oxidoreductase [Eubacteriales bacterium]MDD4513121.1 FAD-dependent oxidoreductase [Eubacteriales bacterium]